MSETVLKVNTFPAKVLRKKAKLVKQVTDYHRDLLSKMARTMYGASGVGLAAPQVGITEALIVVDIGSGLYKLVNPRVVKKSGQQVNQEGCLSLPGVCLKVKRAKLVTVNGLDESGRPVTIDTQGLLACVLQHEIDHLKGKLIVDYASFIERIKISKRIKEVKKKTQTEEREPVQLCQLEL